MNENKYVFRFYNVYTDPENKDKFSFNSPYAESERSKNGVAPFTALGETQYEDKEVRPDIDTLIRDNQVQSQYKYIPKRPEKLNEALAGIDDFLKQNDVSPDDNDEPHAERRKAIRLPHKGISVIGLNDPRYSLYPFDILDYSFISNASANSNLPKFNRRRFNNLPALIQDMYRDTFNAYMRDKYRCGYKLDNIFDEHGNFVNPVSDASIPDYVRLAARDTIRALHNADDVPGANGADLVYSKNGIRMIPKGFDWQRLLQSIRDTEYWSDANALVLAQLPESALYTVDDYAKGNLAAHTDFPEELLARYVTPVSIKGTGLHKHENDNKIEPEDSGIIKGINDYIDERNEDPKRNDINRQYWEDRARTFIENNFNIDSNKIVSDEIKKYIYKDLSSWYNKNNTDKNILDGLTQGGRRWQ